MSNSHAVIHTGGHIFPLLQCLERVRLTGSVRSSPSQQPERPLSHIKLKDGAQSSAGQGAFPGSRGGPVGNGEALLGVVEHNRVSRGGSLEAWDISPGQPGSWILMKEREGRRKPISLQELRLLSLQWYLLQTQPGTLGSTKYREITLIHSGKLVHGRKSVSGFCLHWCGHSCVSSCRFPGVGWVLWVPPSSPLSPFGHGMHSCQADDQ